MSFEAEGFLSTDVTAWIDTHRTKHSTWFSLAGDLNLVLQSCVRSMMIQSDDNASFVASLLFMRGLSGFQGSIVLAERGMTLEARTLSRACFETLFYLAALQKDPSFVDEMIGEDAAQRRKIARALTELPDGAGLDAARIDRLRTFIMEVGTSVENAKAIGIESAAKRAGLHGIYNTYYRGLSNDSAHPSLSAMNRHTDLDPNGEVIGLKWAPDARDIRDTLSVICTTGVYLAAVALELFGIRESPVQLEAIWETYKKLIDEAELLAGLGGTTTT
jgi:hypothetical protein